MRGTMLWFNEVKDFGFITTEAGERVSVHGTGFAGGVRPVGRCAGTLVEFQVRDGDGDGDGEPKAEDVTFVPEVAPRRARLRHGRFRSY
jgi:cold shock CspA family protein